MKTAPPLFSPRTTGLLVFLVCYVAIYLLLGAPAPISTVLNWIVLPPAVLAFGFFVRCDWRARKTVDMPDNLLLFPRRARRAGKKSINRSRVAPGWLKTADSNLAQSKIGNEAGLS